MTDTPTSKFREVVRRLLGTPPKPHNAPKVAKEKGGADDTAKKERIARRAARKTAGKGGSRVGQASKG